MTVSIGVICIKADALNFSPSRSSSILADGVGPHWEDGTRMADVSTAPDFSMVEQADKTSTQNIINGFITRPLDAGRCACFFGPLSRALETSIFLQWLHHAPTFSSDWPVLELR